MQGIARLMPVAVAVLALACTDDRSTGPLGVGPSFLTVAADCQAGIDALRGQTWSATFLSSNAESDRAGLLAKLEDASGKLGRAKYADAIGKLTNYRDKVRSLAAQGKIGPSADVTGGLVAGADAAMACVQRLIDGI